MSDERAREEGGNVFRLIGEAQDALRQNNGMEAMRLLDVALVGYQRFEKTVNGWLAVAEERARRIEELESRLAEAAP